MRIAPLVGLILVSGCHVALAGGLTGESECAAWQAATVAEQRDATYQTTRERI